MQTYTIDIRPRRQTTFPRSLLEAIGADVGDQLTATIKNDEIVLKPKKRIAMDAFSALQKAFQESGIPEEEMQKNLVRIRKELNAKRASETIHRQ